MKCILSKEEINTATHEAMNIVLTYDSEILDEFKIHFAIREDMHTLLCIYTHDEDEDGYAIGHSYIFNRDSQKFEYDTVILI